MKNEISVETQEINIRYTSHPPTAGQVEKYDKVRKKAFFMAVALLKLCPDSREKSLALTRLEEVVFWANAAISRRA